MRRSPTKRRGRIEDEIQTQIVAYLRHAGWGPLDFFHTPNEGWHAVRYRARLHRMGLSSGVPDLIFVARPPLAPAYPHAALEIKAPRGRATPEQSAWIAQLQARGWAAAITRGLAETADQLVAWGYLDRHELDRLGCPRY